MEVARGQWEGWVPSCCSTRDSANISEGSVRAGCEGGRWYGSNEGVRGWRSEHSKQEHKSIIQ